MAAVCWPFIFAISTCILPVHTFCLKNNGLKWKNVSSKGVGNLCYLTSLAEPNCKFCGKEKPGGFVHTILQCTNSSITTHRDKFFIDMLNLIPGFRYLSDYDKVNNIVNVNFYLNNKSDEGEVLVFLCKFLKNIFIEYNSMP